MARSRYLNKKSLAETLRLFVHEPPLRLPRPQRVAVADSLHRITVESIRARRSAPHYHGAAMDGIAVRAEDTFGASEAHPLALQPVAASARKAPAGAFAPIDTGNALPRWANAVIMIENVFPLDDGRVEIHQGVAPWQHVRLVGEDIVATEPLLPRGHRIRPFDIGALLAAGHTEVLVAAAPTVAIIPTGTELVEPGKAAPPGAVIEFNSRMIAAFVSEWGGAPRPLPSVPDDPRVMARAVRSAVKRHDVTTVIAGSSAGTHDYTVGVLRELGEVLVHGIEIMPGKPAICALVDGKPVIGLPGYPVSTAIVCQQVLQPLIARFLGRAPDAPETVRAVLPRKIPSKLGLEEFVRVSLGEVAGRVVANPLPRGAGVITTLVRADGYLRIPSLVEGFNAGEQVEIELLRPRADLRDTIVLTGSHDPAIGVLEDVLKSRHPELALSATNVGSLGGLLALKRGEAHVAGSHLLDPATGRYNLPDIERHLKGMDVVVVHFVKRAQGLIVAKGNPKGIAGLRDLVRKDVRFVNRQPGAGTRVLLDYRLAKLRIRPERIDGYEREEFTHMAVASAVASGLADTALGVRSAAQALGLEFIPVETEEFDLVMRRDFHDSAAGAALLAAVRSPELAAALTRFGGYDTTGAGAERRRTESAGAKKRRE
jgi:putative molybdopterin biosynthesis protein